MEASKSLCDLPCEIMSRIIEFAVVDASPIVDPHGKECKCKQNSYARLPYQQTVPSHSRVAANRRRTLWDCPSTELGRQARKAICEMNGLDMATSGKQVGSTGVSLGILTASKLCYEHAMRHLYSKNVFMFTSVRAAACFDNWYWNTACARIQHVILPLQVNQLDADVSRISWRQYYLAPLPHGPWKSIALGEPKIVGDFKKMLSAGQLTWGPESSLKTVKIHVMDWRQVEIVDVKGTPGLEVEKFWNPDMGTEMTRRPSKWDMQLEKKKTDEIVQNAHLPHWIECMIRSGWTADKVIVSGMEGTAAGRDVQKSTRMVNAICKAEYSAARQEGQDADHAEGELQDGDEVEDDDDYPFMPLDDWENYMEDDMEDDEPEEPLFEGDTDEEDFMLGIGKYDTWGEDSDDGGYDEIKHFFDDATVLVNSALNSLTLTNPSLAFDSQNKIIYRRPSADDKNGPKVSIISGGGSGHEPGFAGFVGKGLLRASVAGTIFASPSAEQVRRAVLTRVPTEKGVLVITMNYTGDVLNFGMAAEKAKAGGVATEFYAIGDDVGVGREKGGKVGRRGIGGGIMVLKICGALAEQGGSLTEVYELAQQVSKNLVSLGSSLERVHVPGRALPKEEDSEENIPFGEIEVGMGIHNEPGSKRIKATLPELVKIMLAEMLDPNDKDRHYADITSSDKIVLFMNNLGATSMLEFAGATNEICKQLKSDYDLVPVRIITGTFLTSLDGLGWSASILKLEDTGLGAGKSMLELLDAPAEAVGWAGTGVKTSTWDGDNTATFEHDATDTSDRQATHLTLDPSRAHQVLQSGLKRVIAAEAAVTKYDTIVGDGDCGIGLKRGAEAILADLSSGEPLPTDAVAFVNRVIPVVENTMDGTSGAIYAIFLNALAYGLRKQDSGSAKPADAHVWAEACKSAMVDLAKYTPAAPGDRTLMDALVPFVDKLSAGAGIVEAAKASRQGAEDTKAMKASLGRAVYVGSESEWIGKVPDPGAWGLAEFFDGMAEAS